MSQYCRSIRVPSLTAHSLAGEKGNAGSSRLKRFFLTSYCGSHYAGSRRARRSSGPARPYIVRLSAFKRLICPSVCPLLQGSVIAFLTASMSLCAVRAKRCIAYRPHFWASFSQAPSLPTLLLLSMPLNRMASRYCRELWPVLFNRIDFCSLISGQ